MVLFNIIQTTTPNDFSVRYNFGRMKRWRLLHYKIVTSGTFPSHSVALEFQATVRDERGERVLFNGGLRSEYTSLPVTSGATSEDRQIQVPVWRKVASDGQIDNFDVKLRDLTTGTLLSSLTHVELTLEIDPGTRDDVTSFFGDPHE